MMNYYFLISKTKNVYQKKKGMLINLGKHHYAILHVTHYFERLAHQAGHLNEGALHTSG